MKIGAHISAAGGAQNAPLNAIKLGCECYQFFSRSPQGGSAPELTPEIIKEFKENNRKFGFKDFYIHAPYYINLASNKNNIYYGSIKVLRDELERGSKLGVKAIMFHVGSAKGLEKKQAMQKSIKALQEILKNYTGKCKLLIEISAGAGETIGDTFQEISKLISKTQNSKLKTQKNIKKTVRAERGQNKRPARHSPDSEAYLDDGGWPIGVCLDTAHMFESGYDIRTSQALKKTLKDFDKIIGLSKLELIHINDSKTDLGSRVDRHEHIGKGKIGLKGFSALVNEPKLKNINLILETPGEIGRKKDLKVLKKLRK